MGLFKVLKALEQVFSEQCLRMTQKSVDSPIFLTILYLVDFDTPSESSRNLKDFAATLRLDLLKMDRPS